jgi:hypothetical protein
MDKFEKKWKEVKYSTGEAVLNTNAMKEIENINVHVRKGCLSGIPPGCGTNRNERLNRHLNQFLLNNKISVPLAYVRCFRLFSQLKCMDTIAKDTALTTSSVPRHIPYEDANDQCLPLPLGSFAVESAYPLKPCEGCTEEKKCPKVNINLFDSNNVTDVATSIQALLDGRYKDSKHDKEDLVLEHDYAAPGKGEEKEHENCLNILRNAICLWRTYLQLTETFGNKVVDIESIGINAKK